MNKRDFWIGIGIGAAVGIPTGFVIGNQVTKKRARRDIESASKKAYLKAEREAKKAIDEMKSDVIFVNSSDPAVIQKAIDEHFSKTNSKEKTEESSDDPSDGQPSPTPSVSAEKTAHLEGSPDAKNGAIQTLEPSDDIYSKRDPANVSRALPVRLEGNYAVFIGAAGTEIRYPKSLLVDQNGVRYDDLKIRANFTAYETDIQRLRLVWNCMGWGTYIPALDEGIPTAEEIDNWDLSIGDESSVASEPEEKTEERRKMVEEIRRNKYHPDARPRIIKRDEFDEETHLDKLMYDYYPVDNVFISNENITEPVDAFTMFGTNNGKELFSQKICSENDNDPNIVYIKNFKMGCVAEITRYPDKAYSGLKDGTAFVSGVT